MKNMIVKNSFLKTSGIDFLFRFGLSSVFLVNSLTAWFSPNEFLALLGKNPFISATADPHFWVYIISINDGLLFLLILSGRWRKAIAVWATLWMTAVIYTTRLEGVMGLIEHIGVLSFVAYYYFAFQKASAEKLK